MELTALNKLQKIIAVESRSFIPYRIIFQRFCKADSRFKLTTSAPCDNLRAWQNLHWDVVWAL
jgi:hypothetical protein